MIRITDTKDKVEAISVDKNGFCGRETQCRVAMFYKSSRWVHLSVGISIDEIDDFCTFLQSLKEVK